ncbi:putative ABC transport system permease protein [Neorhizobium galegae]|uniref:FtsX-like permease family protein n=1 Tax=Neorhizobium galegae TaxID=399 RepID=UPI001AE2FC0D|nr:FtsX-like permease family protein [Neorhizobium galegae]MBP2547223.1 putative ABC transport system permease protein [Neorhizobium galegae]
MIRFILADLRRFGGGALSVVILIALSVALSVAVTLQERAVRLGSARAAEKFDLLVGAPGSETQLALSAVFLQPAPLPLMSGKVLAKLAADPRVALAAPVGFGDSSFGFPIVGTTTALISALSPQLADGLPFSRLADAVVGADVPLKTGAEVKPMHGSVETGGETHTQIIYRVVGRMAPTRTAWDRAILVPIRAVWGLHGMAGAEAHAHEGETHGDEEPGHAHGQGDEHPAGSEPAGEHGLPAHPEAHGPQDDDEADEHGHVHGHVDADAPLDEHFDAQTPGVPAVLVKPKTIADAYRLRQEYRSETTLAVFPAEVLTRLYATLGDARSLLLAIAVGTQGIVIAAILLVATMHIGARKRQIGALRALGAPMRAVVILVWGELFVLFLAGIGLGGLIGLVTAQLISARLTAATAVHLPVEFAQEDWRLAIGFVVAAAVVSLVPALGALRLSPAAALRS